MREKGLPLGDWKALWRRAGDRLGRDGNRLLLIVGLILWLPFALLPSFLISTAALIGAAVTSEWAREAAAVGGVLCAGAMLLFLTLPLLVSWLRMALGITRGEKPEINDLFGALMSRRRYARALRISFGILWRGLVAVLCISLTMSTMITLFAGDGESGIWGILLGAVMGGVAVLLELAAGFFWLAWRFPTLGVYLAEEQTPARELRRQARTLRRRCFGAGIFFFLKWIPWLALVIISVGLLGVADTFPRMALLYFDACADLQQRACETQTDAATPN